MVDSAEIGASENYTKSDYDYMYSLIDILDIPKNEIIYLHVRLKRFKHNSDIGGLSYKELTKLILDVIEREYDPKTIITPTFTYSFTDSGVYHREFSKSETGRFSEEMRKHFSVYRTPDPIFSVIESSEYLANREGQIDFSTAFGSNCWREHLVSEGETVINIDTPNILYGKLHYIEHLADVDYRYYKNFDGVVYTDRESYFDLNYRYFVRDRDMETERDNQKVESYLTNEKVLQIKDPDGFKMSKHSIQGLRNSIIKKLEDDAFFLLE